MSNKPTKLSAFENDKLYVIQDNVPDFQAQADWAEADSGAPTYIKHKPNMTEYVRFDQVGSISAPTSWALIAENPLTKAVGSGFVGIGTAAALAPFHVAAQNATGQSIVADHDIVAFSDERLKADVKRIEGALEKVMRIGGYTFAREGSSKRHAGVLAQEVREVLPEVVGEAENGMLNVAYGNMIALLIEAVKELAARLPA